MNPATGRITRRDLLRRSGAIGLGVPLVSTILAACSPSTAVAPTSPATVPAAPTPPAAAKPTVQMVSPAQFSTATQ